MTEKDKRAPAARFTPGPWRFEDPWNNGGAFYAGDECIMHFGTVEFGGSTAGQEPSIADARLIAAAPDLYEVVRRLIEWDDAACITAPPQEPWKSVIEPARAALAKAEGRPAERSDAPKG